jgi:glycerol uptake operon antiterminator
VSLLYRIAAKPIIAAVRDPNEVEAALDSQADNLFFMGGTVQELIRAVGAAKESGKGSFVHLDLIRGLSNTDKEAVQFIAEYVGADGIVSPKSHQIKEAMRLGLYGVLHLFIIDSLAMENGLRLTGAVQPDAIELMPGIIPKVIKQFADTLDNVPIIASGLIQTAEEASQCIQAGATALSVSGKHMWSLTHEDIDSIMN